MADVGLGIAKQNAPDIIDRLFKEFGYVCNVHHNVDDAVEDLRRLTAKRDDFSRAIKGTPQQPRPQQADSWFERVKEIEAKVALIQRDYNNRCLCCWGSFSPNIVQSYKISRRAVQRRDTVKLLLQEYPELKNHQGCRLPDSCIRKPLPNGGVVGKSSHLAKVLAQLDDDGTTGIISICGLPGVGKSELMRCINNEFLPDTDRGGVFKFVIWVDNASSHVKAVQDQIAARLELADLGPMPMEADAEHRASPIFSMLKDTNFLVLLDNLTSDVSLASLGIPHPVHHSSAQKQVVVLTTPFKDVCWKMGFKCMVEVECLGPDNSWKLFESFVNQGQIQKNKVTANQIIKECGGLPAALVTIGGAMATKREPDDWTRMVNLLRGSKFHVIPGMKAKNTEVLRGLFKSYDRLSDSLKASFLCCSLWPRGCCINKKELIDCWIGLGLITDPSPDVAVLDGFSIIIHLQEAYLLLPGDNAKEQVKLHPIVRDMALWIACDRGENNKWMVHDGVNLKAEDRIIELSEKAAGAERVSLMYSSLQEVRRPAHSTTNCQSLAVLMLQHNNRFTTISGSFLRSAPALKYLDLSHTEIEELPEELGTLLKLEFLNLSFTKVKALPAELTNLERLKHLLLKHTKHLSSIPLGVFRSLPSSLEVIDMYPSQYMDWGQDKEDIIRTRQDSSEEGITRLEQLSKSAALIRSLGITVNDVSIIKILGRLVNVCTSRLQMTNFMSTTSVTICPSGFKELMGSFSLLETLQEISISECNTLEQLVFDGEEEKGKRNEMWCLKKLESLELRGLSMLQDVGWKRMSITFFLQALVCIKIESCPRIRNVSWAGSLNCLQHLELRNCEAVSSVVHDHEPQDGKDLPPTFAKLITLVLIDLPKLSTLCSPQVGFPSLKLIDVARCITLTRIPTKLKKVVRGSSDWLQGVVWE